MKGHKELLGLWLAENEGAKFWLNSVIRKAIKKRKLFPTDDSAKKVIYLAIQDASKRWTMPIRNWKLALN